MGTNSTELWLKLMVADNLQYSWVASQFKCMSTFDCYMTCFLLSSVLLHPNLHSRNRASFLNSVSFQRHHLSSSDVKLTSQNQGVKHGLHVLLLNFSCFGIVIGSQWLKLWLVYFDPNYDCFTWHKKISGGVKWYYGKNRGSWVAF